jgi:hypothetical protein
MKIPLVTAFACIAPVTAALAQTCSLHSPPHTIALLELYTSEGCDSCPPADRFVSALRSDATAAGSTVGQVVPLSLHVDYWDYIGWKDVFARHAFTERQRWLSSLANSRTVYTPEMFISGQELRDWRGGVAAAVQRINRRPAQADIDIAVGQAAAGKLPLQVSATAVQPGRLYVALYQNGLATNVKAGENRGVTLRHDYVVRDWIGPVALSAGAPGNRAAVARTLPLPSGAAAKNLGIAAFVQTEKGEVLQALALPLCDAER